MKLALFAVVVGMLAVLKINAAYVPLDVGFPADRISYILADAGVTMLDGESVVLPSCDAPESPPEGDDGDDELLHPARMPAKTRRRDNILISATNAS